MLNHIQKALSHVGWRTKILGLSALYIIIVLGVGLFAGFTIFEQNRALENIVHNSQARVNTASNARVAILDMGRSLANVVAVSEKTETRAQSVAAIRSLSLLDELTQTLATNLPDSHEVGELSKLIKKMRPVQMEVIKAARKNNDELAMEKSRSILVDSVRVDELSKILVEKEIGLLNEMQTDSATKSTHAITIMIMLAGIGVLIGVVTSFFAAYMVTRPLGVLEKAMSALAEGDLSVILEDAGSDEIGRTVNAMTRTIKNLHDTIAHISAGAVTMNQQSATVGNMAETINEVSVRLHDSVANIKEDAGLVQQVTDSVSGRLNLAAESAHTTSDSTKNASDELLQTVSSFEKFQTKMELTAESTRELSATAEKVTNITDTIRSISSQTNLLALNAAIEAARAGEHGRGFAVVADEVRQLAGSTEAATTEISGLVEGISGSVMVTVEALEGSVVDARDNIARLTRLASEATDCSSRASDMREFMVEVVGMMESQNQAVERITSAVSALFQVSGDASKQTDELRTLSQLMGGGAADLNQLVDQFRL